MTSMNTIAPKPDEPKRHPEPKWGGALRWEDCVVVAKALGFETTTEFVDFAVHQHAKASVNLVHQLMEGP